MLLFFFFKQKTAYEMRISDWSSDVCSSDLLTSVGALVLWSLGMSGFDAISHAMTSIATGGFSNYDASIAHFDNAGIEWAMSVIMLLGSVPFVLYLRVVRGTLRPGYADHRSEARRVGKGGVSTCRSRGGRC